MIALLWLLALVLPAQAQNELLIELKPTGSPLVSKQIHPGWNHVDRSWAVHWFKLGTLEEFRFTNGVAGQNGGGFFFDSLKISGGKFTPLVLRPGESVSSTTYVIASGGGHWWPPRAVLTRRAMLGEGTLLNVRQVSRTLVPTGTAVLPFASRWAPVGASREARLKVSLATGRADPSVDMMFQGVGVWHPADTYEGYAHGGRSLEPSPGYAQSFVYHALLADAYRERNTIDLLDVATGEPIPNPGGVNLADFADSRTRWGAEWAQEYVQNPWYSTWGPRSWNTGSSPEMAEMRRFHLIDGQHLGRAVDDDIATANLYGDPLCAFNVKVHAQRVMEAWPNVRLDITISKGVLGREFGWGTWTLASSRELAGRGVVQGGRPLMEKYDLWLRKAADVYLRCQTPSGLWQCENYPWANWSPQPQSYNVPFDRGLGQSHEHGLLTMGAFAVWRQLTDSARKTALGDAITRAADAWVRPGAPKAWHWLVGKRGNAFTPLVDETFGGWDTVYLWSAASYAHRVEQVRKPRYDVEGHPVPMQTDRYLRSMLRLSGQTPAQFINQMSDPSGTYIAWNLDAAVDMKAAIDMGWTP